MESIQLTLYRATSSFGLGSAQGMVEKAWREYSRATQATTVHDYRDALINGFITAWHLIDWVWMGISQTDRHDPSLNQLFGVSGRRPIKEDFISWVIRECPDMEICQSICNGTKHVTSDRRTNTELRTTKKPGSQKLHQFEAYIEVEGVDRAAIDVLWNVADFWFNQATRGPVRL